MRQVVLSVAVLSVFALGCGKDQPTGGPPQGGPTPAPAPAPGPTPSAGGGDLATATPDVTLTSSAWFAEFKMDKEAAKKKYAGKVIELTGKVVTFSRSQDGMLRVYLNAEKEILGVECVLSDLSFWESACKGAEVVVRGKLSDLVGRSGTLMAVLVRVVKNPAGSVLATDLAKQFKTDLQGVKEKWDEKWAYIEGEIATTGKSDSGGPGFTLKGDGECVITCKLPHDAEKQVAELKPGQRVKILGEILTNLNVNGPVVHCDFFKTK